MLYNRVLAWLNHASVVGVTLESTSRQSQPKQGCFAESNLFMKIYMIYSIQSIVVYYFIVGVRNCLCYLSYINYINICVFASIQS